MHKAFEHGLTPIMCCGESLEQREQGVTMDFIRQQVKIGFQGLTADQAKKAVIAYEPIWAIGTGKTATTEQAQEVCGKIRECIAEVYDDATAAEIRIQYRWIRKLQNSSRPVCSGRHRWRTGWRRFPQRRIRTDRKLQINPYICKK